MTHTAGVASSMVVLMAAADATVSTPVAVMDGKKFKSISTSLSATCAITTTDDLYCWEEMMVVSLASLTFELLLHSM